MSNARSLRDRYLELIDQIVQTTLKGNIRSKEQVYQRLLDGITLGTGEVFEQCLQECLTSTQQQIDSAIGVKADEFKQAKAGRSLRALQTIRGEWERWQTQNRAVEAIATVTQQIIAADRLQRLETLVGAIDPNREQCLTIPQLKQLAQALQRHALAEPEANLKADLEQIAAGITRGLESWSQLQNHVVSWIYEPNQIGFERSSAQQDPWGMWSKQITSAIPHNLCMTIAGQRSVVEYVAPLPLEVSDWVELVLLLNYMQQATIAWGDQLLYSNKLGSKFSISTFLMFALLWSQLARGFEQSTRLSSIDRDRFGAASFRVALQILRVFSQRSYFPLYGNGFSNFPGTRIHSVVNYLKEPLKRAEGTQEKARILTLVGSATRAQGLLDQAKEFHDIAREIAAAENDRPCEIANLNHLSRTCAAQKDYAEAINYSQRALIMSRQVGDRPGEANALVNLGYGEVLQAQEREQADAEIYERAIGYLQQGLKLAEDLSDRQSQALGLNSLGIARLALEQPREAIGDLTRSMKAAQTSGDLYLQGLNLSHIAEAYYRLQEFSPAVYAACLGMYYLELLASNHWRQPAGLLIVLQGQMGDRFQTTLQDLRSDLIAGIGVDGYDHLPTLIDQYRNSR